MKASLALIVLFFCIHFCEAQTRLLEIDSLESLLETDIKDSSRIKIFKKLFVRTYAEEPLKGKRYLDSFESIAKRLGPEKHLGAINSYYASYYLSITDLPNAKKSFEKALENYANYKDHKKWARASARLGSVNAKLGDYDAAMENLLASSKVLESNQIKGNSLGRTYSKIGDLQKRLGNFEASNNYYSKAEAEFLTIDSKKDLAAIWGKIALNYKKLGDYETGIRYINKSINYYEDRGLNVNLSLALNKLGAIYISCDSLKKARTQVEKSLSISYPLNKKITIAQCNGYLGDISYKEKKYVKSIFHYSNALGIYSEIKLPTSRTIAYSKLAKSYAALDDYKQAYYYKDLHFTLKDSLFKKENLNRIENLRVKYETDKKDAALKIQNVQIESLNKEIKITQLRKSLYGIGMFGAIAIAALVYFAFTQRIKRIRLAKEKQEAMHHQEIEFKKKELTSQTLHLVQKNTFIEELKDNLERIKDSPELFKIEFRRLILLLKKESAEDKDWEVFKSYFSEVHNDFDLKLKGIHPQISEKEIRLASFLRMNLSTKEIASMLNVLPDSVLKSKYRLKKKLNLTKEEDLNGFLNSL